MQCSSFALLERFRFTTYSVFNEQIEVQDLLLLYVSLAEARLFVLCNKVYIELIEISGYTKGHYITFSDASIEKSLYSVLFSPFGD